MHVPSMHLPDAALMILVVDSLIATNKPRALHAASYQAVAAANKQEKLRKERDAARQEDLEKIMKRREDKKHRTLGLVSPSNRTPRPADRQDGARLLFPNRPVRC